MIDLFAGCGGLSLGLEQAGFTPWFVNEIVEQFANTYKFNHHLSDEYFQILCTSLRLQSYSFFFNKPTNRRKNAK